MNFTAAQKGCQSQGATLAKSWELSAKCPSVLTSLKKSAMVSESPSSDITVLCEVKPEVECTTAHSNLHETLMLVGYLTHSDRRASERRELCKQQHAQWAGYYHDALTSRSQCSGNIDTIAKRIPGMVDGFQRVYCKRSTCPAGTRLVGGECTLTTECDSRNVLTAIMTHGVNYDEAAAACTARGMTLPDKSLSSCYKNLFSNALNNSRAWVHSDTGAAVRATDDVHSVRNTRMGVLLCARACPNGTHLLGGQCIYKVDCDPVDNLIGMWTNGENFAEAEATCRKLNMTLPRSCTWTCYKQFADITGTNYQRGWVNDITGDLALDTHSLRSNRHHTRFPFTFCVQPCPTGSHLEGGKCIRKIECEHANIKITAICTHGENFCEAETTCRNRHMMLLSNRPDIWHCIEHYTVTFGERPAWMNTTVRNEALATDGVQYDRNSTKLYLTACVSVGE
ncbi:uncharacterized protein LOC135828764 [Sycon ciliatum]|uniref:uncharacterized protein LOC135828764 n=1 Tax=Sycon ciliatum TaxID=27933 RepID=UPI0031F6E326